MSRVLAPNLYSLPPQNATYGSRQSFMSCRNIFSKFLIILHKFEFLISFFFQRKFFTKGRAFQFFLMDSSSKRYTKGQADYSLVALRVREAYIRELKKVFN